MITLDPGEPGPLYLQIATRLRAAIAVGAIASGVRLPSTRTLSAQLGVARGTIDAAYDMLAGEGAIEPRGAAGTVVAAQVNGLAPVQPMLGLARTRVAPQVAPLPFQRGLPALDAFPRKLWSALTAKAARAMSESELAYPDPCGALALREEIVAYLGLARGIVCGPHQVLVTTGYQGGLTLVRQVLLRPGDPVWVEDPGHPQAFQALEVGGASLVPVPVDAEGLRVAAGVAAAPRAKLAVVTPTHQSPLGVSLSLPRRLALLAWAEEARSWVLEDDYDAEFRYAGPVPRSLKSLDRGDRVIFAGSFSKTLFPGLRLGYLVVPEALLESMGRAARLITRGPPLLEQNVTASFMAGGHFARHVKRMRGLYARRRAALVEALAGHFPVELAPGGMHLLARLPDGVDDGDVARRAAVRGLAPMALSSLSVARHPGNGLLLGFTNVREADAAGLVRRLVEVVES
ncbi:MAG: PLP-dependent aminotransferase family protein [Acetobacteraceae bacterium]|nr:PLP-dependent aminotransferase family protein [Acetobacteraceae bacterium]